MQSASRPDMKTGARWKRFAIATDRQAPHDPLDQVVLRDGFSTVDLSRQAELSGPIGVASCDVRFCRHFCRSKTDAMTFSFISH